MDDLITLFKISLEENSGIFHLIEKSSLGKEIKSIAGENEVMYSGVDEFMESEILNTGLKSHSLDRLKDEKNLKNMVKDVNVGITGTDALAAESGSIVLVDYNYMKSFAAFLPEIHIAIAYTYQIFPTLFEAIDNVTAEIKGFPVAIQVIQGPSKTGDIEKKIVRPSHGPRELHVILMR